MSKEVSIAADKDGENILINASDFYISVPLTHDNVLKWVNAMTRLLIHDDGNTFDVPGVVKRR